MCVSSYVRQIHVVYCTHLAEVILEDGGKIKTELTEPLIIFLEIIKANEWAFGELDLDAVLVAQTFAGKGTVWCPCERGSGSLHWAPLGTSYLQLILVECCPVWLLLPLLWPLCCPQQYLCSSSHVLLFQLERRKPLGAVALLVKWFQCLLDEGVGGDVMGFLREVDGRNNLYIHIGSGFNSCSQDWDKAWSRCTPRACLSWIDACCNVYQTWE